MRIGDFAKKYNMNVTAIRYYIENALLTPQRKNNQYIFDQSCIDDMDKVLEYKECGLTLEEIEINSLKSVIVAFLFAIITLL